MSQSSATTEAASTGPPTVTGDRARGYVLAARADTTRRAYANDWAHFTDWCTHQHAEDGADFTEVQLAVQQGRAATPSRLQPAAHVFAEYALGVNALGRLGGRRLSRRTGRLLLVAYFAAVVVALVVAVANHLWRVLLQSGTYLILYPIMIATFGRRRHRAAQAASDANAPVDVGERPASAYRLKGGPS